MQLQLPNPGRAIRRRVTATKEAFSSVEGFKKALLVQESDGFSSPSSGWWTWSNAHMDPTPPAERTWGWINYFFLWWSYGFSTGVWTIGSSMIASGLTAWQAIICVFIAHLLGAIAIVVNSRFGATYHIGYPVFQRISFGVYGSLFPVLLRSGTGLVWVGVQIYQGGKFTSVIIRCIFGNGWKDIPNTIPASSLITTTDLAGTLIFWAITFPLLFIKVHNTRWLWTIKAYVLPPCVIGLFIYTQVLHKSSGTTSFGTIKGYSGSTLAWTMLKYINSAMGKVNQPDLARYAKTRTSPLWSQLLALPIANTAVACLGIFATSSTYAAWGKLIWNPWDLCTAILDRHWEGGVRFAVLLVSLAFTLSIFVSNQAANVIPFGADITALCPRVLNINRGQIIAYCLALPICPWYILNSVSCADYFFRKGNIHVPSLYTGDAMGQYYYTAGVSWKALVAFWVGCAPTIPGFAGTFGNNIAIGAVHLFYIGWLYATISSTLVYLALCSVVPDRHMRKARQARFEQWADEQADLLDRERTLPVHRDGEGEDELAEKKKGDDVAGVGEVIY
ncbi:hypothetical protein EHS25_006118 [Saitozyma podzolica]|uniref:Uracil permease n=1 Tax=Saitozyma podzolica TaxID=1890683 RepID=A0A427XTQ8_9TREE|nr:hypothetical protein EHS25_006118 [Saitozyma podzolica]